MRLLVVGESPYRSGGNFSAVLSNAGLEVTQVTFKSRRERLRPPTRLKALYGASTVVNLRDRDTKALGQLLATGWDAVFLYGDHSHPAIQSFLPIAAHYDGPPVVLGLHNHQCSTGANPLRLLEISSGVVFLNENSQTFFLQQSPGLAQKEVRFIPSLYLPRISEYRRRPSQPRGLRESLRIAAGGRWITAESGSPWHDQSGRYNFVNVLSRLAQTGARIDIFGQPRALSSDASRDLSVNRRPQAPVRSKLVRSEYLSLQEHFPNIRLRGTTRYFESKIAPANFFVLKGFTSADQIYEPFEQMNYQLRYSSSLLAGVPTLVAAGTDAIVEADVGDFGWGHVYEDPEILLSSRIITHLYHEIRRSGDLEGVREANSIDRYTSTVLGLLFDVA